MKRKTLMTPTLQRLFDLLNGQVYFVGGAVRDVLMNRPVHDMDLTTPLTPEEVTNRLKNSNIRIHPTGIEHGTLTLTLPDKTTVEITSFRCDMQTDGRHATVVFGTDVQQDAFRRDFTINALYMDGKGKIADFVGGLKDLKKKRLRFIGKPEKRIEEDALRILRYFRFFAQINPKKPDLPALKACRKKRNLLDLLSKERIRDEMLKLLSVPNPQKALHFMARTGVLKKVLNDYNLSDLGYLFKKEKQAGVQTNALFRLWVLCQKKLPDWPLSRVQKRAVRLWILGWNMSLDKNYYEALFRLGRDAFLNLILLKKKKITFASFLFYKSLKEPTAPFCAKDVAEYFHLNGRDLGKKLKLCEDVWLKMNCPIKKEVVFKKILG